MLGLSEAIFKRNRLRVELMWAEDLDLVIRSIEAIIEGVNFDTEFGRALPRHSPS